MKRSRTAALLGYAMLAAGLLMSTWGSPLLSVSGAEPRSVLVILVGIMLLAFGIVFSAVAGRSRRLETNVVIEGVDSNDQGVISGRSE